MPVEPPFHTYREQLWPLFQGLALWKPNTGGLYDKVSIGDVGYVSEGAFIRMFNVTLPWDDESNTTFGIPDPYEPLGFGHLSIRRETFDEVDHYSRCVSRDENANNMQAASPDQADGVTYSCRGRGALLSLPHGGRREDAVQMKIFEKYIQDNVVSWFAWAQRNQLGVERMEDLILVTGCTLVTTWAAAVFMDHTMSAEISLASRTLSNGGASFVWSNVRGPIVHHNSRFDPQNPPTTPDQCVFIKGFRAKRGLFRIKPLRAAAEPLSDDPDNRRDSDILVTPVPGVPKYRDPLIGVLDYIAEKCIEDDIAEDIIAIAHDDDLHFIEDVKTLTADEIESRLHERNMPTLVESGAAILRIPRNNTSPVSRHLAMSSAGHPSPLSSPTASIFAAELLPPLPEIRSEQIRKRIFTHSRGLPGCHKHVLQAPEDDPPVDNEEFRHLGDQVFTLAVTDAIQKRYPHLRIGTASKVRDLIKRRDVLAEICMSYGLHMKLNLPERQACDLRASQDVQVDVFKAYVGGVYRDQGADVASNWLISLLRPHIEVAYRSIPERHFLPPDTEVALQLETPAASESPSPFSSTTSEHASPALSSYLAGGLRDHRQLPPPQANLPQQSSAQAGDGIDTHHAQTDKTRVRRRRRSILRDDGSEDPDGTRTDAPLPKYKALVIGINYTWSPDGYGPSDADLQLKGPINDAKAMKKTLKEVYNYREQDISLMTDEEDNKGTEMWPSAQKILRAMDDLVRGASPGDAFVFYYAGHCARQASTNNNVEDEHTYIIACDLNHIFDNTLRERLVDPLPKGSRLTAIMDACYSGPLLALNHYRCHQFLRRRCQSLPVSVRSESRNNALRRHTEVAGHLFLAQSPAFLRRRFSSVVTTTLAIIRLKSRVARRNKSEKCERESRPPTPTPILVHCTLCNRDHDLSDAPDVISLSLCTEDRRTWEYSTRNGKGVTVKLIRILKKDPSIKLGDLNQQINNLLSKLSFERVRKATAAFRRLGELVTSRRREELERKYKDHGVFDFNEQTAQFGSLRPLRLDDRFILERDWTEDRPDPD